MLNLTSQKLHLRPNGNNEPGALYGPEHGSWSQVGLLSSHPQTLQASFVQDRNTTTTEELCVQADICPVSKISQPTIRNKCYLFQETHSCLILSWDEGNDWDLVLGLELVVLWLIEVHLINQVILTEHKIYTGNASGKRT